MRRAATRADIVSSAYVVAARRQIIWSVSWFVWKGFRTQESTDPAGQGTMVETIGTLKVVRGSYNLAHIRGKAGLPS
jgi:hypothetical protein